MELHGEIYQKRYKNAGRYGLSGKNVYVPRSFSKDYKHN